MKEHNNEKGLIKFLERPDNSADYVRRTAEWIKKEFPGSAARLLPILRRIYKDKMRAQ